MISHAANELLLENEEHFLIDADNVATLLENNSLEHALLVLTKIGYSRIPVLNKNDQLVGSIALSKVVDAMFDTQKIDPDRLSHIKISDVMDTKIKHVKEPYDIEKILNYLVDGNYVHVVDDNMVFKGIVTRKEILKSVNHLVHVLDTRYTVIKKQLIEEID
ncbi:cyclic-di-AMP-binding protein CbpB [Vagococcus vulneris]|uniref:CBS domain-containing protein n=1 Tax=Vagococcus vulneris TaxID=1977869 RepID=A0A430A114_9ENTE|nr:cyclic-di-AMP-binding protein CbpB [Vagococcus vulneris]RSU00070.1 hypothetical protein CBF37_01850 [Vagococcus vulneris]